MELPKLNLPKADLRIKTEEGNRFVFDIIRKKFIHLTPEEWVRQHVIHLMVEHLEYPKSLIKIEQSLQYFKSGKRSDILLRDQKGEPFLLVECKAPQIQLGRGTLNQASTYNKVVRAKYLAISNGLIHFIWHFSKDKYTQLSEFPKFES